MSPGDRRAWFETPCLRTAPHPDYCWGSLRPDVILRSPEGVSKDAGGLLQPERA